MYQRARKLQENAAHSADTDVIALMEEQLEAYLLAINSLSLLDTKCAWVVTQAPSSIITDVEVSHQYKMTYYCLRALLTYCEQSHKRRKLSKHIPDSTFTADKPDSEIVDLNNIKYDYMLLSARLRLIRRDPTLLSAAG